MPAPRRSLSLLLSLAAAAAGAQEPASPLLPPAPMPGAEPARPPHESWRAAMRADTVPCAGQPVREIVVYAAAPTVAGLRRVPLLATVARSLHVTTRPEIVRRFLFLRVGDPCSELRRAESERVLRAQPYLADAAVLAVADDSGGVRLEVYTVDEASLVAGVRARGSPPFASMVRFGSSNVMGAGVYAAADWRRDRLLRDGYGVRVVDHQFLGQPYVLEVDARRAPLGGDWRLALGQPFLTDLQRVAWWGRAGDGVGFTRFERDGLPTYAAGMRRAYSDVGVLARVGPPRRLALVGTALSWERELPDVNYVLPEERGEMVDTSALLRGRYAAHRLARGNLLLGVRVVDYVRVRGFDALTAVQDLPVGVQLGALVGRGTRKLGGDDRDLLLAGDLFAGTGGPRGALRLAMQAEGRRTLGAARWDGVLTSGQLAHYARFDSLRTVISTLDWSGGWEMRVPFALRLGARDGGVRGYERVRAAGARRAVLRTEDRRLLWRIGSTAQFGWAWRAEVGRIWAGDVPLGVTTPLRPALGVSLLAAYPAQSARLWRLDATVPVFVGGRFGWTVRLSRSDRPALVWRAPGDIAAPRERAVPVNLFDWP